VTNHLRKAFAAAVFFIALTCAVSADGQIKTGGYKAVSVDDAGVKEAANFAVESKAEETERIFQLEEILKAERQTVAGTNYRLCLLVTSQNESEEEISLYIKTVVFKNLKGEMKISSWEEEENCGEK